MGLFSKKEKNLKIMFRLYEGLPSPFVHNDVVYVTLDKSQNKLFFDAVPKKTASLDLDKIIDVRDYIHQYSGEAPKNFLAPVVVGTLLGGQIGGAIGAVAGSGTKKTTKYLFLVVITYFANGKKKRIFLRRLDGSWGWKKFVAFLPKDPNSPYAPKENKPIEL